MPLFELLLKIAPSFHRQCSIQIEGGGEGTGLATFEAHATGLLRRVVLTLPVDYGHMVTLHDCCVGMLAGWDARWSRSGLDGISIAGMFDSSDSRHQEFVLWSPDQRSAGHAMLTAALDCFPFERCGGAAGELLEIVRSYFGLQPPVTVTSEVPPRLRLAPWVHGKDAAEIEKCLRALPEDGDLIVDASGVERFGLALASILPMAQLLKRSGTVRWKAQSVDVDVLTAHGVEASAIEIVQHVPISPTGDPIVLGGLFISNPELIDLAIRGGRIDLVRAFRQEYGLTIEQASKAAGELREILAANPIS